MKTATITKVDLHGLQGRDLHPQKKHEGKRVAIIKMDCEVVGEDGAPLMSTEEDNHAEMADMIFKAAVEGDDTLISVVQIYICITEDGEKLELADYELEFHN